MDEKNNSLLVPFSFLENPNIDSNSTFIFLKSKLKDHYSSYYKNKNSTSKCHNHLYANLHLLLSEVVMTKDPIIQLQFLENCYKWFLKKSRISIISSPAPEKLSEKIQSKTPELFFNQDKPKTKRHFSPFLPKNQITSRKEILEEINRKYIKMKNEEKIPLRFFDKKIKTPKTSLVTKASSSSRSILNSSNIVINESPSSKSPQVFDFRPTDYKVRSNPQHIFKKLISRGTIKPLHLTEMQQIKDKFSSKNSPIDYRTIEYAISKSEYILEDRLVRCFPKGGELLLKK